MALTPYWNDIQAEYLKGAAPRELAKKYNLKARQISDKAKRDNWKIKKDEISEKTPEKVQENLQETITQYSKEAIQVLHNIMTDPESENKDKISAAKAILDVSGLKTQKIETNVEAKVQSEISDEKIDKIMNKLKTLYD